MGGPKQTLPSVPRPADFTTVVEQARVEPFEVAAALGLLHCYFPPGGISTATDGAI